MPADLEVGVELVPDESALEDIEEKQLQISGEAGSVEDAKELNEEQSDKLTLVNRKLGRVATRLGKIGLIAATLALIAKILGSVLDIGFEDVRDGIVEAVDTLIDPIKNAVGLGGQSFEEQTRTQQIMTPGPLGFLSAVAPGLIGLDSEGGSGAGGGGGSSSNGTFNLFTSRDQLTGDSTQQEQDTQNFESFSFKGGS